MVILIWWFGKFKLSSSVKLNVRTVYIHPYPYVNWIALVAKLNTCQFTSHTNLSNFMSAKCTAYTVASCIMKPLYVAITTTTGLHT